MKMKRFLLVSLAMLVGLASQRAHGIIYVGRLNRSGE